uniref:Uncharacterized protein n=1 Tax=Parascaris univalens TaxID=6257 RepID=A0A915AIG0_PARUN
RRNRRQRDKYGERKHNSRNQENVTRSPSNSDYNEDTSTIGDAHLPIEEETFWKKGDTILMHHQSIRNRRLKITLDTEMSLGECRKCVINANGTKEWMWVVPCDMTGLSDDALNGSKPQKRPIRIRVHPETLRMAETNKEIAISVRTSATKLLEEMLGEDWSITAPSLPDVRIQHVQQLRKLFASTKGRITHANDCVIVSWAFDKSSEFVSLSSSSVLSAFSLKILKEPPSSDENHSTSDVQSQQLVALRFIREDICEPLLQLHFIDSHEGEWLKVDRKDHSLELDERGFRMILRRSNCDVGCSPFRICEKIVAFYFDENGDTKKMMLVDSQKRIEELRRRLDESLSLFQRQQKLGGTASSKHSNDKSRRMLTVLYQDEEQTIIQVSGSTAMNYSVDSLGVQTYRKVQNGSTSSPLQVVVGAATGHSALMADSLPSSPAGSVDSGISSFGSLSSSPSASPGSSPVYIREDGIINQLRMRQRSTSECVASTGLKSILKKTPSSVVCNGRLARSISECQHPDEKEAIECLTSTEVLEEIDKSNESLDCMTVARKKRVSFSERLVQERSFRPNSSILGQKKKNQRKSRNKLKKKTSEEISTDDEGKLGSDDGRGCNNDSLSIDVAEKQEKVDGVSDPNASVDVVHENNANDEAGAAVEAGTIRRRVLRSSTDFSISSWCHTSALL